MPSTAANNFADAAHAASAEPAVSMIRRMRIGPIPSVNASRSQCSRDMEISPPQALERPAHDVVRHVVADDDVANAVGQDEAQLAGLDLLVEVHRLENVADVQRHPAARQTRGG